VTPRSFSDLDQLIVKCVNKLGQIERIRNIAQDEFREIIENIANGRDLFNFYKVVMKDSSLIEKHPELAHDTNIAESLDRLADLLEQHNEYARADALRLIQLRRTELQNQSDHQRAAWYVLVSPNSECILWDGIANDVNEVIKQFAADFGYGTCLYTEIDEAQTANMKVIRLPDNFIPETEHIQDYFDPETDTYFLSVHATMDAQVIGQIEQEKTEQTYLFVSHEDPREEILILEKLLNIHHGS
jgi:hypothetical protein